MPRGEAGACDATSIFPAAPSMCARPCGCAIALDLEPLDDAAVRVVQLASPFQPLPHTSEDIDILEITRTWDYKNGSVESE
mgnify:CR=1 FL=1